ncbi:unnamed protein product [Clonostachys solani]|uniref:Gastric mucin-like protein n=1 Tax=Clonostachys solani TaxID=160281 RepID=A0A9N9YU70_9HYPO|nr:unnamed protein product [Clonostachys solani]
MATTDCPNLDCSKTESLGSLVAFEGHPETISTQLRLLPTSPQILILPSIHCYLPTDDQTKEFEAHSYIRDVHEAVKLRNNAAQGFLKGSTSSNKRLVFMNGGTSSAQALCIRAIMRHETHGDDIEAEAKFNFLVKGGLGGLASQAEKWIRGELSDSTIEEEEWIATPMHAGSAPDSASSARHSYDFGPFEEDPITRAMRAAEALDRQTASLQPSNDLDLTFTTRPRSMSLPMYGFSDNFGDAAPFYVFGAPDQRRSTSEVFDDEEAMEEAPISPVAPVFSVTHYDQPSPMAVFDPIYTPSCIGETYSSNILTPTFGHTLSTSKSEIFGFRSTADVVFGEASVVDMRMPSIKTPVTRVMSLDRIYSCISTPRDLDISSEDIAEETAATALCPRPRSCMVVTDQSNCPQRLDIIDGPRTVILKPRQASVVSLEPVPLDKKRKVKRPSYVDRGTDAEPIIAAREPFVPVFILAEDLVVYFKDEVPDALLATVIQGFKDGIYPVLSQSAEDSDTDSVNDQLPSTPRSSSVCTSQEGPENTATEPSVASPTVDVDEYDPFAYLQSTWTVEKPAKTAAAIKLEIPPTPQKTPTPSVSDTSEKFTDFLISNSQNAVLVQNSLRSVLSFYFPPETQGYRQFSFSLLPELEALWKPIFREAEPGSPRATKRRIDQILAIGSQRNVAKEYSSVITGLLDKLGSKKNGVSRSGRLDFRYLLANAMQAYTAQPLANQASDNPFNNSYLLATLIIPHLETYLALHTEVRYLLLEYPPEHLSTILALQKLVGVDLMKVAQIVDSKSGNIGAFKHIRGASIVDDTDKANPLGHPIGSPTGESTDVSVSKANFLLTSSASDAEIATFISTVRKLLIEVSKFYNPEESQVATPTRKQEQKPRPPPLTSTFSPFPKTTGPQSPKSPLSGNSYPLLSPALSMKATSVAETIKTSKSLRSSKSRKSKLSRRRLPIEDDEASVFTYDPAEDSDYDFEERRLMPIFLQKPSRLQKPNSRKALKFLGLA